MYRDRPGNTVGVSNPDEFELFETVLSTLVRARYITKTRTTGKYELTRGLLARTGRNDLWLDRCSAVRKPRACFLRGSVYFLIITIKKKKKTNDAYFQPRMIPYGLTYINASTSFRRRRTTVGRVPELPTRRAVYGWTTEIRRHARRTNGTYSRYVPIRFVSTPVWLTTVLTTCIPRYTG